MLRSSPRIQHPVEFAVSQDAFHVVASLGKRYPLREDLRVIGTALGGPARNARAARIVGRERSRNVRLALEQRREMPDTDLDVDSGIVEKGRIPRLDAGGWGDRLPHRRHHLHQAPRSGRRSRARIEIRFLTDEASYERGVQTSAARLRDD